MRLGKNFQRNFCTTRLRNSSTTSLKDIASAFVPYAYKHAVGYGAQYLSRYLRRNAGNSLGRADPPQMPFRRFNGRRSAVMRRRRGFMTSRKLRPYRASRSTRRPTYRRRRFSRRRIGKRSRFSKRGRSSRRSSGKRFVARNLPSRLQDPPRWHIYRHTASVTDVSTLGPTSGISQWYFDLAHGQSKDYDGLVALMCMAKANIYQATPGFSRVLPLRPMGSLRVLKSYMVLYMTNNSSTPVYVKMAVFKPRKHINDAVMRPSPLANNDIGRNGNGLPNEWWSQQAMDIMNLPSLYTEGIDFTDDLVNEGLAMFGVTWKSSPTFRRYYTGKIKEFQFAPQECKKFIFKKRGFSLDMTSEYTLQPATSADQTTWPANYAVVFPSLYAVPTDTGFAEMHARRGMYISFLCNGIPAATTPQGPTPDAVTLTQPYFDMFWLNAYKYGWSPHNFREFHSNTNPLIDDDAQLAIPMPGSIAPGPVIVPV